MKKVLRKVLALLLAVAFVTTSACSLGGETSSAREGGGDPSSQNKGSSSDSEKGYVELDVWMSSTGWMQQGFSEWNQLDSVIGEPMAKETGIAFTNHYPGDDPEITFNLKLSSGEWEDVIDFQGGMNKAWMQKLIEAGVVVPLDEYFEMPDKYPNLANISDEILDHIRWKDGHIYAFPTGWAENPDSEYAALWCAAGWYVATEYLEAVNMTKEDLGTLEGIEAFLKAVKNADLKTAEGQKVLPMTCGADLDFINTTLTAFGMSTATNGWDFYNGELKNYRELDNTKQALAWLNKLQVEGLLDPEYATQTNDMLVEKMMSKRVAMVVGQAWGFWETVTAGVTPVTETYTYVAFPQVEGIDKLGIMSVTAPYGGWGWAVTKNCRDIEAVAKAADWGNTPGQNRYFTREYGPVGILWDWSDTREKPYFKIIDEELKVGMQNSDREVMTSKGYQMLSQPNCWDVDPNFFNEDTMDALQWIFGMHEFNFAQGYSEKPRDIDRVILDGEGAWAINGSTIRDIDLQYAAQMIAATSEAEFNKSWDEYQESLKTMGKFESVKEEFITEYEKQIK